MNLGDNSTNNIPPRDECIKLMIRYSMLPNIMAHSFRVMEVAIAIVDNLKIDVQINREIVMAAALLHDITKTRSLITRERHDTSGAVLLREMGYTDVADIVEQHVILNNFDPQGALEEKEIVFYADKRVMHDQVVTLEERVEDLLHRYGKTEEIRRRIIQNLNSVYAIETKIAGLMTVDLSHAIHAVASSAGDSVVKNSDGCTGDYA